MADVAESPIEKLEDELHQRFDPYLEDQRDFTQLLEIVGDALRFTPPLWVDSILGHPWTWLPPHPWYSEFSIVSPMSIVRSLKYLADVTLPALPIKVPESMPGGLDPVFWRPTRILFQPDPQDNPYSFPAEAWFFINGIATNESLAEINARYLAQIFHRPLTIVQNTTDSIGLDLIEASIGKAWQVMTEASLRAYPVILQALNEPTKKRVVVICHSQGTIIMANVLRALISDDFRHALHQRRAPVMEGKDEADTPASMDDPDHLAKLEIYAFANAADVMRHAPTLTSASGAPVPYIENIGNQYDVVARLGMLAPNPDKHDIVIDGEKFEGGGRWGHCLNLHYLSGLDEYLRAPAEGKSPFTAMDGSDRLPRLYGYYGGQTPAAY